MPVEQVVEVHANGEVVLSVGTDLVVFQESRVFVGLPRAAQARVVRRERQDPRVRVAGHRRRHVIILRRSRPACTYGHIMLRAGRPFIVGKVELRIDVGPQRPVRICRAYSERLSRVVVEQRARLPASHGGTQHGVQRGAPALPFAKWEFVGYKALHNLREVEACERVSRAVRVLEILNAGVAVVIVLLRAEGVALGARPDIAHVHGQSASGVLDNIGYQ